MNTFKLNISDHEKGSVSHEGDTLVLTANAKTDWFHHPADEFRKADAVSVQRNIAEAIFSVSAKVEVDFNSPFDGGSVFLKIDDDNWGKIAFELSGEKKPTIVSVITRSTSDDADGPNFSGSAVWLRLYTDGKTVAFHFSEDGKYWRFLRWFALPNLANRPLTVGFGAQAPTGDGCTARFSDIKIDYTPITDLRNGS